MGSTLTPGSPASYSLHSIKCSILGILVSRKVPPPPVLQQIQAVIVRVLKIGVKFPIQHVKDRQIQITGKSLVTKMKLQLPGGKGLIQSSLIWTLISQAMLCTLFSKSVFAIKLSKLIGNIISILGGKYSTSNVINYWN